MMGYNEIANQDQLNLLDPFKGANARKFRPLAPRLNLSPPTHNTCLTGFHTPSTTTTHHHILSLNNTTRPQHNQFGGVVGLSEENNSKEVAGANQVMVSSRWNPTPEQLRALEELYRRGTRTPSAEQIQHITAQLRRYGKIEGKNVFYWFQNHKARERQKRRRQLQIPSSPPGSSTTRGNRVGFEGEQMSCKGTPSSTNNKESGRPITQIIADEISEGKSDQTRTPTTTDNIGWIQFHEPPQFQHNHTTNNTINNNIITNSNSNNNSNNNNDNDNMINISPATNLMFAGERNGTWQSQNNFMVQPLTSLSSSSCCCCYTTPILSKINHLLPDKSAVDRDVIGEKPTLHLFPVVMNGNEEEGNNIIASDDDNNINVDMGKEDERENDDSLLLLQTTCCNIEKATSFNRSSNNNNPFPYYQFL